MFGSVNAYNFVPKLPEGVTLYWRVGYIRPKNVVDTPTTPASWTLAPNSWESDPYSWTMKRTFKISVGAPDWDRCALEDEGYLTSETSVYVPCLNETVQGKGAHPRILFDESSRRGLYLYLNEVEQKYLAGTGTVEERNTGRGWNYAKTYALSLDLSRPITNVVEAGPIITDNPASYSTSLSSLAFVWQLTKAASATSTNSVERADAKLHEDIERKDPAAALTRLADFWITYRLPHGPPLWIADTQVYGNELILPTFGYGYDWLYELMDAPQRAKVRKAIDLYLVRKFGVFGGTMDGSLTEYPTIYTIAGYSPYMMSSSHQFAEEVMESCLR